MTKAVDRRERKKGEIPQSKMLHEAYMRFSEAEQLRRSGKYSASIKACEAIIEKHPDYVGALHTLGLAQMAQRNYWASLSCFTRAAMLNPKDWTILTSLAQVYLGLEAPEMAAYMLEQSLAIKEDPQTFQTLGLIYENEREYEKATTYFERALISDPENIQTLQAAGGAYVHLGLLEQAADVFSRAHNLQPSDIFPLCSIAQLPRPLIAIDLPRALEQVTANEHDDEFDIRAAYLRAAAFDKQGDYKNAWINLEKANKDLGRQYSESNFERQEKRSSILQKMRILYSDPTIHDYQPDVPVSLFILGVSRSGKTTLEYLASFIDGVKRGYENPIVERSVRLTSQKAGLPTITSLLNLPLELDTSFAENYIRELNERIEDSNVFTNTHPGRIIDVGRIATRIPNAKFVFVNRDRNDTALRIYGKHYKKNSNMYAYTIPSIDREIFTYGEFIDFWCEVFPEICWKIDYNEMISDPEETIKSISKHIGLGAGFRKSPQIGDDRQCSLPYTDFLEQARRRTN